MRASIDRIGNVPDGGFAEITAIPEIARTAPTTPRTRNRSTRCRTASRSVNSGTDPMITEAMPAGTRRVPQKKRPKLRVKANTP